VDFTAADMRGTIYGAAEFLRCKFNHARLNKVDSNRAPLGTAASKGSCVRSCSGKEDLRGNCSRPMR
jgi:hypothetical protein